MANKRKEMIQQYMKQKTIELLLQENRELEGVDALNCALDLGLDRANVSREFNKLWKDGALVKIQGKPVYYLDYQVLTSNFPDSYIPSVISKDENLNDYIKSTKNPEQQQWDNENLDSIIGANGSLSDVILNAKSAVTYPPYGLPCMILGNHGVGKTHLAHIMHAYACSIKKDQEVPFEILHCQNFQNHPEEFAKALIGYKKNNLHTIDGYLKKSENGILLLEQASLLPVSSQQLVCSIIAAKEYTGPDQQSHQLQSMIIVTDESNNDKWTHDFKQYFPISLQLLDIDQRGIYEKIELILDLFSKEAQHVKLPIRVSKDIIACFASKKFPNNISQMRNEIQIACSKAYLEMEVSKGRIIYITYSCLSLEMLSQNEETKHESAQAISLLSCIENNYIQFDENGHSTAVEIFEDAPSVFNDHRLNQFVDEFNINVDDLDNLDAYVSENMSVLKNCPEAQLQALKKNINPYVYQVALAKIKERPKFKPLTQNTQLLYGILLHITNFLKRLEHQDPEEALQQAQEESITKDIYHDEYMLAKEIYSVFEKPYQFHASTKEIDFLASYLAISSHWANKTKIAILVITHGESIASQMVNYIQDNLPGKYFLDSIDYRDSIQLNDCLELACMKAIALNQGAGVLVACDMEPLTGISEYIIKKTGIPSRTIEGINLPLLIQIIDKSISSVNDLDTLTLELSKKEIKNIDPKASSNHFVDQIANKIISHTAQFIDVRKAVNILSSCLDNTLEELNLPYSDALAAKYLCHCTNMLERCIQRETWNFAKIHTYYNDNTHLMHVVEHHLKYAQDVFGTSIPITEIAYVAQIFDPYFKES